MSPTRLDLREFALGRVAKAIRNIIVTEDDRRVLDEVLNAPGAPTGEGFFPLLSKSGHEITPGLWVVFLDRIIHNWDDGAADTAVTLPYLREIHPSPANDEVNALLDAAASALESLGWDDYRDQPGESQERSHAGPAKALYDLAMATERIGDPDNAYDLTALALDLGGEQDELLVEVARYALRLAESANRVHQIAFCRTALARTLAANADTHPERRLEVFDHCEAAIGTIQPCA